MPISRHWELLKDRVLVWFILVPSTAQRGARQKVGNQDDEQAEGDTEGWEKGFGR